jgi:hypothetical protein
VNTYLHSVKSSTDTMFDFLFETLPAHLEEQRSIARKYAAKPSGH